MMAALKACEQKDKR